MGEVESDIAAVSVLEQDKRLGEGLIIESWRIGRGRKFLEMEVPRTNNEWPVANSP